LLFVYPVCAVAYRLLSYTFYLKMVSIFYLLKMKILRMTVLNFNTLCMPVYYCQEEKICCQRVMTSPNRKVDL